MTELKTTTEGAAVPEATTTVATGNVAVAQDRDTRAPRSQAGARTGGRAGQGGRPGGRSGARPPRAPREKPEFDSKTISIRRVTRVVSGGRRFTLSVALVAGDKQHVRRQVKFEHRIVIVGYIDLQRQSSVSWGQTLDTPIRNVVLGKAG